MSGVSWACRESRYRIFFAASLCNPSADNGAPSYPCVRRANSTILAATRQLVIRALIFLVLHLLNILLIFYLQQPTPTRQPHHIFEIHLLLLQLLSQHCSILRKRIWSIDTRSRCLTRARWRRYYRSSALGGFANANGFAAALSSPSAYPRLQHYCKVWTTYGRQTQRRYY